jgi:hypothetical protein
MGLREQPHIQRLGLEAIEKVLRILLEDGSQGQLDIRVRDLLQ